ncbi:MAG: tetratricopeptide repeat protein, partial [Bacteroidota bacterium]
PSLPDNNSETLDLSEKSAKYDADLVTENLAEIMLKQGKKNKAIKIYQQLMLKFPDKKAYFAEKIEKLN